MSTDDHSQPPRLSVIVPCKNEAENLPSLIAEIAAALSDQRIEIIIVDDGSTDGTAEAAFAAGQREGVPLRVVQHANSAGQSAAVRTGMLHAKGEIIICTDGDGQNDPQFMPALVSTLDARGEGFGMVGGQRVGRKDTAVKRAASRLANQLRGALLADKTRDSGCGLKAVRADVFARLPYFDGWHRFMAALVLREGYDVDFVDVIDRPRQHGVSKYGVLDRALVGLIDMFGVWWLKRRYRRRAPATELPQPQSSER
ncbi:MAG: glycosyltransferase family 2 protein [Devosiaceae bacterium]|nr:glycosyltransferase family 2 protein [Devosiaceae bacterium MH13]